MDLNKYFKWLIYLSLIFLIAYLYKIDYLSLKNLTFNYYLLAGSIFLLFVGFLVGALAWNVLLASHKISIRPAVAIASIGLAIFAKYIPGKLWVVLGRASYVSLFGPRLRTTSLISLKAQLLVIWLGLFMGGIPFFLYYDAVWLHLANGLMIGILTIFLFNTTVHQWFIDLLNRLTGKKLSVPVLQFSQMVPAIGAYTVYWLIWTIGFYLLCRSIYGAAPLKAAFAFPLGATIGIIAIIFPGGIGVREGIMVAYLSAIGVPVPIATTISVVARLWFLSGEAFIFIAGLIARQIQPPPITSS